MVTASEILDIIEIIYYVPALFVSLYVCYRQGFRRESGWIVLVVLSLLRLIGGSTGIASVYHPTDRGLIEASLITSTIGSAALVAAFTGIINRVNFGIGRRAFPARITRQLQLLSLAAVILGIIGGVDQAHTDPDTQATGHTLTKVAVILILIQFLATIVIAANATMNMSSVMDGDRRLLFLAWAATPFLLVRVIYSICSAFNPGSKTFSMLSFTNTAIIVRGVMGLAMEFIVVGLFLFGGCVAPKWIKPGRADPKYQQQGPNMMPVEQRQFQKPPQHQQQYDAPRMAV